MCARAFHLAWLAFVLLWFAVIAPGHTRGTIRLGGGQSCHETSLQTTKQASASHASCCVMPKDGSPDKPAEPGDAPADPAACCAVCYFNATLQVNPPVLLVLSPVAMVCQLPTLAPADMQATHHFRALASRRGPPGLA